MLPYESLDSFDKLRNNPAPQPMQSDFTFNDPMDYDSEDNTLPSIDDPDFWPDLGPNASWLRETPSEN